MTASHLLSSGRGGAGNIVDATRSPKLQPEDLQTPTLKTPVVTTGRGGSGNMASSMDPAEKRMMQDVEPVTRRTSSGATHIGRGGTGNVFDPNSEEARAARLEQERGASAVASDDKPRKNSESGWAEKGKNLIFGKK